jgi:hypothetical protein
VGVDGEEENLNDFNKDECRERTGAGIVLGVTIVDHQENHENATSVIATSEALASYFTSMGFP